MKNVSIIYWSGTGNTQKMAGAVAEGTKIDGVTVRVIDVLKAAKEDVLKADAIAMGCPSMGGAGGRFQKDGCWEFKTFYVIN